MNTGGQRWRFFDAAVFLLGLIVAVCGLAADSFVGPRPAVAIIAVATVTLGASVFVSHGGPVVTASGVYFLAVAVFGGVGGLLMLLYSGKYVVDTSTLRAILIVYLSSLATYSIFVRRTAGAMSTTAIAEIERESRVASVAAVMGPVLLVVGVLLSVAPVDTAPLPPEVAYCGVVVAAGALIARAAERRLGQRPVYLVVTIVVLVAYVVQFFSGYGRLNLVTLGIALAVLYTRTRRIRWLKAALLVAILPLLLFGGAIGANRTTFAGITGERSRYDIELSREILAEGQGLYSLISPLLRFSQLLAMEGEKAPGGIEIGSANGSTFLVAFMVWVPRDVWADKPVGFGRELALIFAPYKAHSEAGLIFGEWFFNFGYLGVFLSVVFIGLGLAYLDRRLARVSVRSHLTPEAFIRFLVVVVLVAGVADYVWTGTFAYMSRAGIRAMVLGLIYLGLALVNRGARRTGRSTTPTPVAVRTAGR